MRKVAVALMALTLGGCAQQIFEAASADCQAYGFAVGTPAYSQCVQTEVARRRAAIAGALQNYQAPQSTYTPIQTQRAPAPAAGLYCVKTGEQVTGMTRQCAYNCAGSPAIQTVSAAEICPISITR